MGTIGLATLAGLCTGLATLLGALPVLLSKRPSDRQQAMMLGFAAGVMLSASYLSLIVPAAAISRDAGYGAFGSAAMVAVAVAVGAASLHWVRRWQPFERALLSDPAIIPQVAKRASLLTLAMTAHNLPEGTAVGVAFAAKDPGIAISTAIGIGIQNLPEGLAVAAALLGLGWRPRTAVLIAGATGAVEPLGAFLGASLVSLMGGLLPVGMGWAAGAMIYICAAELIPAVHEERASSRAMKAFLVGITAMLFLDIALS